MASKTDHPPRAIAYGYFILPSLREAQRRSNPPTQSHRPCPNDKRPPQPHPVMPDLESGIHDFDPPETPSSPPIRQDNESPQCYPPRNTAPGANGNPTMPDDAYEQARAQCPTRTHHVSPRAKPTARPTTGSGCHPPTPVMPAQAGIQAFLPFFPNPPPHHPRAPHPPPRHARACGYPRLIFLPASPTPKERARTLSALTGNTARRPNAPPAPINPAQEPSQRPTRG